MLALAGCAMQPDGQAPPQSGNHTRIEAPTPARGAHAPRVGLEYLAPEGAAGRGLAGGPSAWLPPPHTRDAVDRTPEVVVESIHSEVVRRTPLARTNADEGRAELPWAMSEHQLARVENPAERFTLQFLHHVLGKERRGVQRNITPLILFNNGSRQSAPRQIETLLDERDRDDQQLLMAREARRLLKRPLQRALRDSTIVRDLEVVFDDFRADHLPLSTPGEDVREDDTDWGRVSMRVRPSRMEDPFEVTYVRRGWRFGGGQRRLKASYRFDLTEYLNVGVRTNYRYETARFDAWGDLYWRINRDAHLHVLAGSRIDLLTGSRTLPLVQRPVVLQAADESLGMMFYVEHVF